MAAELLQTRHRPRRCCLRILVADNDVDAVSTLSAVLQHEGHEVIEVYRSAAVLELTRRHQPDVVLLDIGMPELSGFEVARIIRRELGHACPLLIAITAWKLESAKALGKLVGFNHYLVKPYSTDNLLDLLSPLIVTGLASG